MGGRRRGGRRGGLGGSPPVGGQVVVDHQRHLLHVDACPAPPPHAPPVTPRPLPPADRAAATSRWRARVESKPSSSHQCVPRRRQSGARRQKSGRSTVHAGSCTRQTTSPPQTRRAGTHRGRASRW